MKKFSNKQKRIFCGVIAVFLLTAIVVSFPTAEYLQVNISDQSMPLGDYPEGQAAEIARLQEALNEANDALAVAEQNDTDAQQALELAQANVAATSALLGIEVTKQEQASAAAAAATAAATEDEALAAQATAAQAALSAADESVRAAQENNNDALEILAQAEVDAAAATQAVETAQTQAAAAEAAFLEAGGTLTDEDTSSTVSDTNTEETEEGDEDNSTSEENTFSAASPTMLMDEEENETNYQVVLHVLNNKLLHYNNAESTNSYIQAISTVYTTLTPELVQNEAGEVTEVTLSAEALAAAGVPEPAVGYSDFIGWSTAKDIKDTSVIAAPYSFDISTGVADEEDVITFNLYAKYNEIPFSFEPVIHANGQTFQPLAYPADTLAATGNLPASVLHEPIHSDYLEALDNETGSLYGHKDAKWENYEEGLGSIQFDFIMQPQTYDSDIIIVMDKSTSMPSGYIGGGISNWTAAVQSVNNLAQGLMSDANSANNRVALVQFSGNTINSFNFQNNWTDFDSRFVETAPSGCHYFRDADGNIIQDYDNPPEGATIENPSGDGTNYTLALEQARVFAESRGETDRELVVLFVSDGKPEALSGFSNPSNLTRAWTRDYNGVTHHSVAIAASNDQSLAHVVAANGQSVLASFSPTIYTIGIGVGSNAENLVALSTQTGGSHNSIGWNQAHHIDSLSNIADTIFGESELLTEMTDAIISDVITDEFALLIDNEHPVTLQKGDGEALVLTSAQGDAPDVNEYLVETIDYNGEEREQITVNIGSIDRELIRVKFFVQAANPDMGAGNHPTNEEHTLTYNENDVPKSRDNLGEPELPVEAGDPPLILLPTVSGVSPTPPTDEPTSTSTEETENGPADEPTTETESVPPTPETPAATPETTPEAPAAADFAFELPGGVVVDFPDSIIPLATVLQDTSIDIGDTSIPLAGFGASWALLNLLLTVATALGSAALLIGYFVRKKNTEENNNIGAHAQTEEESPTHLKRKGLARLLSIPVGVIAIIVFIFTEDMTLPMTLMDEWTLLMFLIFVVQMVLTIFSRKKFVKEEDKPKHAAP